MQKIIHVDHEILGGTPVFMNTRVPIKNLFDYLAEGETITDFLADYPTVQPQQVKAVLEAAQRLINNLTTIAHETIAG